MREWKHREVNEYGKWGLTSVCPVDRTNSVLIYILLRQYDLFSLKPCSQPVSNYVGNYAYAIGPGPTTSQSCCRSTYDTYAAQVLSTSVDERE